MTVSLKSYALATVAELMEYLGEDVPSDASPVNSLLNRATAIVETFLGREVVTRGTLTEYHTMPSRTSRLYLLESPVQSITSVHEDSARGYGASTALAANTDYISNALDGVLMRVAASAGAQAWATGFRAIKVVYAGGYADRDALPDDLRDAFFEVCAWMHSKNVRKNHGVLNWQDDAGNFTRVSVENLPRHLRHQLASHRRFPLGLQTGERDAAAA